MKGVPGALAVATVATCAIFAAATGIIGAVVTLMGLLVLKPMLNAGYDKNLLLDQLLRGLLRHFNTTKCSFNFIWSYSWSICCSIIYGCTNTWTYVVLFIYFLYCFQSHS